MSRALWIRPFAPILTIMLISAGLVRGATLVDNFDDNSLDPNLWDLIENGAALDEANQRVEYTSLEVLPDQEAELVLKVLLPYETTWSVTLDVHVDDYGLAEDPSTYEYGLGLEVANTVDPTDQLSIGRSRGYDGPPGFAFASDWGVYKTTDDEDTIDDFIEAGPGLSDGTMKIVWDGMVFGLYYDEGAGFRPARTDISIADWGMGAGSTFTIIVGGFDTAVLVPLDDPNKIYFDNFVLTQAAALDDGLVAYYPFNGDANDESGNANHGAVHGATLTADRFGNSDSAYSFDGVNDYIGASADNLPTAERTVSLWFYANRVNHRPTAIGYGGLGFPGRSWFQGLNVAGAQSFHLSSHWNTNRIDYSYPQVPVGRWFHWVITTDVNGTKMYVDGEEKASNRRFVNNTYVSGRDLVIGVCIAPSGIGPYTDGNVKYWDGAIDDIRIYNRALSDDEIVSLYLGSNSCVPDCDPDTPVFIRGDANSVTGRDVSDAVTILRFLFLTMDSLDCEKAADVDDSGLVEITDAVFLLRFLFSGGAEIPAPTDCGIDPTPDDLECGTLHSCNG